MVGLPPVQILQAQYRFYLLPVKQNGQPLTVQPGGVSAACVDFLLGPFLFLHGGLETPQIVLSCYLFHSVLNPFFMRFFLNQPGDGYEFK